MLHHQEVSFLWLQAEKLASEIEWLQNYLIRVIDDTSDFLGVALQNGNNLLRILVKDNSILVISTWTQLKITSWKIVSSENLPKK